MLGRGWKLWAVSLPNVLGVHRLLETCSFRVSYALPESSPPRYNPRLQLRAASARALYIVVFGQRVESRDPLQPESLCSHYWISPPLLSRYGQRQACFSSLPGRTSADLQIFRSQSTQIIRPHMSYISQDLLKFHSPLMAPFFFSYIHVFSCFSKVSFLPFHWDI